MKEVVWTNQPKQYADPGSEFIEWLRANGIDEITTAAEPFFITKDDETGDLTAHGWTFLYETFTPEEGGGRRRLVAEDGKTCRKHYETWQVASIPPAAVSA